MNSLNKVSTDKNTHLTHLEGNNNMNAVNEAAVEIIIAPKFNKALTKARFKEVVAHFRAVINGEKKPVLCFRHFILYAMIKGSDISKTTHSTDSETFKKEVEFISTILIYENSYQFKQLCAPFDLSAKELKDVVEHYQSRCK